MRRVIIGLICFCIGSLPMAFGSGKLMLTPAYYHGSSKVRLSGGLNIYEQLPFGVAVNAFAGVGETPILSGDDLLWLVAKANLDFKATSKLSIGPGFATSFFPSTDELRSNVNVKFTYTLW